MLNYCMVEKKVLSLRQDLTRVVFDLQLYITSQRSNFKSKPFIENRL